MADSKNRFMIEKNEVKFIDIKELEKEGTLKKYSTFDADGKEKKEKTEE